MYGSTRREFLSLLAAATAGAPVSGKTVTAEHRAAFVQPAELADALAVVSRHKVECLTPPIHIPKSTTPDALMLGNGSMLAAFAGNSEMPQFWLTLNSFWEMREWGGPRPLGRVVLEMPPLHGADFRADLDLASATLTSTFSVGNCKVKMKSWVPATENLLIVEIEAAGFSFDGRFSFRFPDQLGLGVDKNEYWDYQQGGEPRIFHLPDQETTWVTQTLTAQRTYHIKTTQPTRAALAARFLGRTGSEGNIFYVDSGDRQIFIAACESWFSRTDPMNYVRDRVANFDPSEVEVLRAQHIAWWERYWSTSQVDINDPAIERQYYLSHYNMGSLSRDPDFPPCDYGICTSDDPVCAADYKLNYNYETGFLGLNAAGHFEQTAPYDSPGLAHLPKACADSRRLLGHAGAYMSLGLGPKGMIAEHIWLGQKSQNAFYLVNIAERWYLTRDVRYGSKVYPLVREVARFWEEDLHWTGVRYNVINDSAQEDSDHRCINPASGVALVRMAMRLALDLSAELKVDQDKHEKWKHIVDQIAPIPVKHAISLRTIFDSPGMSLQNVYPSEALEGKQVIVFEEDGIDWSFECNIQMIPIYPAGEIGLDSDPALLQAARNTLDLRVLSEDQGKTWHGEKPSGIEGGAWFDGNTGCLFFPAAVRIGHDPEAIWQKLREWCSQHVWSNGFRRNINDGIENCSTIPNTIHEMMVLSHEGVLRIFRVWPRRSAPDAQFKNLWAYGGFQVSSSLSNGKVQYVRLQSHSGRTCVLENPWPGQRVRLTRNTTTERLRGDRFRIPTAVGEIVLLEQVT